MTLELVVAMLALMLWTGLILGRGGFWLGREHDNSRDTLRGADVAPENWPSVVAVVPARNEAEMLPRSLATLLDQDYRGPFAIVIVDDQSDDGSAEAAGRLAEGSRRQVSILRGRPLPQGWTGKVWALQQGIAQASTSLPAPDFLLLTDADIGHAPDSLSRLIERASAKALVMTSLMAKLNCESFAERGLIPAFIFFFQMLYPFAWVNARSTTTAAAAGGCMLVDRRALERAGGIASIRDALIDDCALARLMKAQGPIWLGLTERAVSLRSYPRFADIRGMVARSAYAQLRYSPLLLAATVAAMTLTYIAAPLISMVGAFPANLLAGICWALMAGVLQPTLRQYRLSPLWGVALPLVAAIYVGFTIDSAYQHWHGRGGAWKGRLQAMPARR